MAPRCCIYVAQRWRLSKAMLALFVIETPLTIACLVLFALANPDTYRTTLWQNGSDQGFNSNPNEILYAYANYKPISVPLVWSSFMTKYNVIISVLSMFVLLVKSAMFVLHALVPLLSVFVHVMLITLYAVAVRNQATPDLSNKKVPHLQTNLPWYLGKGCSYATKANKGYCMQARASFAVTCVMVGLFTVYFALAVWSSVITKAEKEERKEEYETDIELKNAHYMLDPDAGLTKEEKWERNRQVFLNLPKTPNTPGYGRSPLMTPRTTAFTQLSGGNVAAPAPVAAGSSSSSSRPLAFREQYGDSRVPDAI